MYLDRDDTADDDGRGGGPELRAGGNSDDRRNSRGTKHPCVATAARADVEAAVTTFRTIRRAWSSATGFSRTTSRSSCAAMWHDDHRTFIQTSATELARALRNTRTRMPALVNFEVQDGTYVVPKILTDGLPADRRRAPRVPDRRRDGNHGPTLDPVPPRVTDRRTMPAGVVPRRLPAVGIIGIAP